MQRWSPGSRSFVLVIGKCTSSIFIEKRILLQITLFIWVCMFSQLLAQTS
ncbi:hypothetical protein LINGRAHAP2_LOCUS18795 [Linum grandiflorum]